MADAPTPERLNRIREVLRAAQQIDAAGRAAFVSTQCQGDATLEREIEHLLFLCGDSATNLDDTSSPIGPRHPGPAHAAVLSAGDVIAERFTIVRLLGRGGMGEVYEADDAALGERVALKVMRGGSEQSRTRIDRFR